VRLFFATDEATLREGCARVRRFAASRPVTRGGVRT
jgi:hypothetical protein